LSIELARAAAQRGDPEFFESWLSGEEPVGKPNYDKNDGPWSHWSRMNAEERRRYRSAKAQVSEIAERRHEAQRELKEADVAYCVLELPNLLEYYRKRAAEIPPGEVQGSYKSCEEALALCMAARTSLAVAKRAASLALETVESGEHGAGDEGHRPSLGPGNPVVSVKYAHKALEHAAEHARMRLLEEAGSLPLRGREVLRIPGHLDAGGSVTPLTFLTAEGAPFPGQP
jgi:hypothetical protein